MASYLFSSESVTEGHPDKLCDAVSDAVLDACLKADPYSRVACETVTKTGFVMVCGEITTKAVIDFPQLILRSLAVQSNEGKSSTKVTFDKPGTYTLRAYALDGDAFFVTQDVVVTVAPQ